MGSPSGSTPSAADRARLAAAPTRVLRADAPLHFELVQSWREAPETDLRPTRVAATWRDGVLHVVADLEDDDVFNDATAHNQRTWELGDVFEIFVRAAGADAYREVHVTPDNVRLHLCFDDFAHVTRIEGIESVAADPDALASQAWRTPDGWRVAAAVPLPVGTDGGVFVSFCRYDAARRRPPILSSSSPHPVLAFHRPWEWTACRVQV